MAASKPLRIRFFTPGNVLLGEITSTGRSQACGILVGETPDENRFLIDGDESANDGAVVLQTVNGTRALDDWEIVARNGKAASQSAGYLHLDNNRVEGDQVHTLFPVEGMGNGPWSTVALSLNPQVDLDFRKAPMTEQGQFRTIDCRINDRRAA